MEGLIFKLAGVGYRYDGGIIGLKDTQLEVREGNSIVVLGPNGSGKSTLLKILDGLYLPSEGEFYAFGEKITEKRLKEKAFNRSFREKVSLLFQDTEVQLFSPTVADEIAFGLRQLGIREEEVKRKLEDIAKLLGISQLKRRYPYSLSGGEKRKVAIASVLCLDSKVYLLDEPTANIDPQTESRLIELIVSLKAKGKTLIIATQDLLLAEHVADYILLLGEDKKMVNFEKKEAVFSNLGLLYKLGLLHAHQKLHKFISSYIHTHYEE